MVRILVLSLFICPLLVFKAWACSSFDLTTNEDFFNDADRVFVRLVRNIEFQQAPEDTVEAYGFGDDSGYLPFGYVLVHYELKETLKGPGDGAHVATWNLYLGGCGVPILAGAEMVFLVKEFSSYLTEDERRHAPDDAVGMVMISSHVLSPNPTGREAQIQEWREIASRTERK